MQSQFHKQKSMFFIFITPFKMSTVRAGGTLDFSNHSLNNSSSKQKFSFPKATRFQKDSCLCESYYDIPNTKGKRSTSFGYGRKDMGIRINKNSAEPGSYNFKGSFEEHKKGTFFGPGREEMAMNSPLKESIYKKFIPGPSRYKIQYSTLDDKNFTIRSKIRDRSQDHLTIIPGPGTYGSEQLGNNNYYINSKRKNRTNNVKIAPMQAERPKEMSDVGPGRYNLDQQDMKVGRKYILSKNESCKARQFTKAPRESIVTKQLQSTPGPGNYSPFTYFSSS